MVDVFNLRTKKLVQDIDTQAHTHTHIDTHTQTRARARTHTHTHTYSTIMHRMAYKQPLTHKPVSVCPSIRVEYLILCHKPNITVWTTSIIFHEPRFYYGLFLILCKVNYSSTSGIRILLFSLLRKGYILQFLSAQVIPFNSASRNSVTLTCHKLHDKRQIDITDCCNWY